MKEKACIPNKLWEGKTAKEVNSKHLNSLRVEPPSFYFWEVALEENLKIALFRICGVLENFCGSF